MRNIFFANKCRLPRKIQKSHSKIYRQYKKPLESIFKGQKLYNGQNIRNITAKCYADLFQKL